MYLHFKPRKLIAYWQWHYVLDESGYLNFKRSRSFQAKELINPLERHQGMLHTKVREFIHLLPPSKMKVENHLSEKNSLSSSQVVHRGMPGWMVFLLTTTVCISVIFIGTLSTIFSIYTYYHFTRAIVPGVKFGNQKLSGMNLTQAALTLHRSWESEMKIQITNGTQSQNISPSDLGYEFDPVQTAQKAMDVGRGGSVFAELAMMFASWKDGWQVSPAVKFNEELGKQALQNLAPSLSQPPKNASISLQGGDLIPIPGQVGYTVDVEATLKKLKAEQNGILTDRVILVIPQFIPAEVTDATPALGEAKQLLNSSVNLNAYDPITDEKFSWPIPRERLAEWLETNSSNGVTVVSLNVNKVGEFLREKNPELGQGRYLDSLRYAADAAQNIRQGSSKAIPVSHEGGEYTIDPGDTLIKIAWNLGFPYWVILKSNPGLNPDKLITGSKLTIPSKDVLLPLPPVPDKRIVIGLRAQRLKVYQGGEEIRTFVISTGIDRSPTQPGIFQVQSHQKNAYASVWNLHMPNFLGIYEAWPGFMNGIHGLPTLSNGRRLWADILGKPASFGCIILDLDNAQWLYNWAEDGVVVEIQP